LETEPEMSGCASLAASVANDPGCVKTHTSAKCRKYISLKRHRTSRAQYDLTLRFAIALRCFYLSGEHWSFHTAKTHCGQSTIDSAVMHKAVLTPTMW
jgi:hypothetical protein